MRHTFLSMTKFIIVLTGDELNIIFGIKLYNIYLNKYELRIYIKYKVEFKI